MTLPYSTETKRAKIVFKAHPDEEFYPSIFKAHGIKFLKPAGAISSSQRVALVEAPAWVLLGVTSKDFVLEIRAPQSSLVILSPMGLERMYH